MNLLGKFYRFLFPHTSNENPVPSSPAASTFSTDPPVTNPDPKDKPLDTTVYQTSYNTGYDIDISEHRSEINDLGIDLSYIEESGHLKDGKIVDIKSIPISVLMGNLQNFWNRSIEDHNCMLGVEAPEIKTDEGYETVVPKEMYKQDFDLLEFDTSIQNESLDEYELDIYPNIENTVKYDPSKYSGYESLILAAMWDKLSQWLVDQKYTDLTPQDLALKIIEQVVFKPGKSVDHHTYYHDPMAWEDDNSYLDIGINAIEDNLEFDPVDNKSVNGHTSFFKEMERLNEEALSNARPIDDCFHEHYRTSTSRRINRSTIDEIRAIREEAQRKESIANELANGLYEAAVISESEIMVWSSRLLYNNITNLSDAIKMVDEAKQNVDRVTEKLKSKNIGEDIDSIVV